MELWDFVLFAAAPKTRFTIFCNYSEEAHNAFNIAFTKYRLKIASVLILHNLLYIG